MNKKRRNLELEIDDLKSDKSNKKQEIIQLKEIIETKINERKTQDLCSKNNKFVIKHVVFFEPVCIRKSYKY